MRANWEPNVRHTIRRSKIWLGPVATWRASTATRSSRRRATLWRRPSEQAETTEQLRQQDQAAGQALSLAEAQAENIRDRWTRRLALIQMSTDREKASKDAEAKLLALKAETQSLLSRRDEAEAALLKAVAARDVAEERVALSQSSARVKVLDEEIAELDRRLRELDALVAERSAAQHRLSGIKIDKRSFNELQDLESAMREARAALGAIATRFGSRLRRPTGDENDEKSRSEKASR